jgi:endonuclease/exonuclease/phosphatase family metal-dependent hydrolase
MRRQYHLVISTLVLSLLLSTNLLAQEKKSTPRTSLRAMSFNIRLGVAKDGANHWDKRKDFVVQTIKNYDADFIGTQETWEFQAEYLSKNLPDYTYVGRSRQNDKRGEQCGIFFRTSRFAKLIEGHFWLSESPDQPGSKSWDSSIPRMATWLKLWDRENKKSFFVINTHFDHRGNVARTESAKLIRKFVNALPEDSHVLVTGDFNAAQDSNPHKALFAKLEDQESPVIDSYRVIHTKPSKQEGTFNGFRGTDTGARIDWIAVTRGLEIKSAEIDRSSFEEKYPSDHFPVTAEVEFK